MAVVIVTTWQAAVRIVCLLHARRYAVGTAVRAPAHTALQGLNTSPRTARGTMILAWHHRVSIDKEFAEAIRGRVEAHFTVDILEAMQADAPVADGFGPIRYV